MLISRAQRNSSGSTAEAVKQFNPTLPLVIICRGGEEARVGDYAQVIIKSTVKGELLVRAIQSAGATTVTESHP